MTGSNPEKMETDTPVKEEEKAKGLSSIPPANGADDFADDMAALDISSRKSPATHTLEVGIAVQRGLEKTGGHLEYELLTQDKFRSRYGELDSPKNYPWLLDDQKGTTVTRARAFYSVEFPKNTNDDQKTQLRKDNWDRTQEAGNFKSPAYAVKNNDAKAFEPTDERAQFETSAGIRVRKYGYIDPHLVGAELPEIELTVPRSDGRGNRKLLLQQDNPRFLSENGRQMTALEMGAAYGDDKVRIADTDGRWDSVAQLNARGRYEADRRLAKTYGMDFAYNRRLPDIVVETQAIRKENSTIVRDPAGDQLVSMDLVRNAAQHASVDLVRDAAQQKKDKMLAQIAADVDQRPRTLKAGIRINESTYVSPSFAAKKYPEIYKPLAEKYNLPKDFETINSLVGTNKAWIHESSGIFITADAAKRNLPEGLTVVSRYGDLRTFTQKTTIRPSDRSGNTTVAPGKSLKMLYATLRDRESITPEIGKQIGVAPRIGHYDQRAIDHASKVVPQKTEELAGYDSGSDTPQNAKSARQQMIANRGNKRNAEGMSVGA